MFLIPRESHTYTEEQLKAALLRANNVYSRIANTRFGISLPIPAKIELYVPLRGSGDKPNKIGEACWPSMKLRYNLPFMLWYPTETLNETVPHEVAHLVISAKFREDRRAHGPEWAEVMKVFGKNPYAYKKQPFDTRGALLDYRRSQA